MGCIGQSLLTHGGASQRISLFHHGGQQCRAPVRPLPWKIQLGPAVVAVDGKGCVDGPAQGERVDDCAGAQIKDLLHRSFQRGIGNEARSHGVHRHADRAALSDDVCDLHFTTLRQPRGHEVLRHPAGCIRTAAVRLGGVLAGERAAADVRGRAVLVRYPPPDRP